MNDDKNVVKTATRLLEGNDVALSSWDKIFSSMHSAALLNLVAAARTALEYGSRNKIIKGLPKKNWEHAVKNLNETDENIKQISENFVKEFLSILQEKKIKIT